MFDEAPCARKVCNETSMKKSILSNSPLAQINSPIIPKEFASLYKHLAVPDPDPIHVPDPYPTVTWSSVRFKPSLPSPKPYPVHGCSPDPDLYEDKPNPYCHGQLSENFALFKRQNPFGTLLGYQTNLGVVDVPTTPVG